MRGRRAVRTDAPVSRPGDAQEREADAHVSRWGVPPASGLRALQEEQPLDDQVRRWAEPRFGYDFTLVRVHNGEDADAEARSLDARAFTFGSDITFARGQVTPSLLAHELAHVAFDRGQARQIHRKTKGEDVVEKARTNWLDPDVSVKADVDVIKAALREVKTEKSVEFNRNAAKKKIFLALTTIGKSGDAASAETEWDVLVDERKKAGSKNYLAKEKVFLDRFETPLATLTAKFPKAQTKYWLKNTPSQVVDEIAAASDADMPADQLYAYAMKEGLVDYVRDEIGLGKTADPSTTQLFGVSTTKSISGFGYLGTDDFFTELTAKEPLTSFLPKGYDTTKLTRDPRTNELNRTVESAIFPNLRMGLQALAAMMKRRRKIFRDEVVAHGYSTPSTDELVYWTYVYYNAGEFNGQLAKYTGKRKLSDWITNSEYPNAIKLLQSWQMVKTMNIF